MLFCLCTSPLLLISTTTHLHLVDFSLVAHRNLFHHYINFRLLAQLPYTDALLSFVSPALFKPSPSLLALHRHHIHELCLPREPLTLHPPQPTPPPPQLTPLPDIKPSNILLCRDGTVKLCDFGVSGEFGTRGDADTFIGTSYYMAPERITGQKYNITSDVWSLGVTLLEVAQHRFPFPADSSEELQPRAGLIDIIQYIVGQPLPKLRDETATEGAGKGIVWSENFKYFIDCWYVFLLSFFLFCCWVLVSCCLFLSVSGLLSILFGRLRWLIRYVYSLERDPQRRATPWRMLEHPWMVEMKEKKVKMERFLREVWNWKD